MACDRQLLAIPEGDRQACQARYLQMGLDRRSTEPRRDPTPQQRPGRSRVDRSSARRHLWARRSCVPTVPESLTAFVLPLSLAVASRDLGAAGDAPISVTLRHVGELVLDRFRLAPTVPRLQSPPRRCLQRPAPVRTPPGRDCRARGRMRARLSPGSPPGPPGAFRSGRGRTPRRARRAPRGSGTRAGWGRAASRASRGGGA